MRTTRTASSALRERARRRGRAEGPLRAAEVPRTVVGGENGRRAGLCAKRQRSTETGARKRPNCLVQRGVSGCQIQRKTGEKAAFARAKMASHSD